MFKREGASLTSTGREFYKTLNIWLLVDISHASDPWGTTNRGSHEDPSDWAGV